MMNHDATVVVSKQGRYTLARDEIQGRLDALDDICQDAAWIKNPMREHRIFLAGLRHVCRLIRCAKSCGLARKKRLGG